MNIGIIGAGFVAQLHGDAYQRIEGVTVKGVCDFDESKSTALANKLSATAYTIPEELIASPEIDTVVVCLPTFLHEDIILSCAKHKKHIFCEKPLTLSLASTQRIIAAIKTAGIRIMVGHVIRFWPEYRIIEDLIRQNKLGKIKAVYAARLGQMPGWASWFEDPSKSGGALYDLHIHDIDYVVHLFGMPLKVSASGFRSSKGAWNHVFSNLIYSDFPVLIEGSNQLTPGYPFTMNFRAVGESATIEYLLKAGENLEDIAMSKRELILYNQGGPLQKLTVDPYDAYFKELEYFVQCMNTGNPFEKISMESVVNTMSVVDKIETSLESLFGDLPYV